MRAYKCDICGRLYEGYEFGCRQYYFKPSKNICRNLEGIIQLYSNNLELDICPSCRKDICDFINERVKD